MQNSSCRVWFVFAYIEFFRESVHRQILGQMRHQVTVKVARGGFKHHTSIGVGHMKDVLKEAFTTYLGYEWVDIDN